MEFGISTMAFGNEPLDVDRLETLRKSGYRQIELFCVRPHLDFHNRGLQRAIGRWFHENLMVPLCLHLPFVEEAGSKDGFHISILDPERRSREFALDKIKRSLDLTDFVRPEFVVMHLGNFGQAFSPAMFDYAYAAIAQISSFSGVRVLIENGQNDISTIARLRELKSVAQLDELGFCYDIGHSDPLAKDGPAGRWNDIRLLHLNDNRGGIDEHLWPFEGSRNWPAIIANLVQAKYDGAFVFEVSAGEELSKAPEVVDRLSSLWAEAQSSMEEFRLKYRLPVDVREED